MTHFRPATTHCLTHVLHPLELACPLPQLMALRHLVQTVHRSVQIFLTLMLLWAVYTHPRRSARCDADSAPPLKLL